MSHRAKTPRLALAGVFLVCAAIRPAHAAEFKFDGRTFTVPDGFIIERVAGPGLVDRPVVASFDEQGRLYVADSSGSSENVQKQLAEKPHRIVRLEDADGDGRFDRTVVFADKMMFPAGAMWLDGSLYVSAPPTIWKLTDTDSDGVADRREEWMQGKTLTGCANDLHGPYAGPDGWVYWCKGAFAEQTYDRPGRKPLVTTAAHVFRKRPDGSAAPGSGVIEPVMTGGMDNPIDVVFTPGGERVFSSTFLQHPAGGRRDGLIHAVYGGVYGKVHDVIDSHPRTRADVMPVLSHLGPAAPCGLTRYESEAFGEAYRDNLFCTLFNMHKVTRHVLTPDGATFKAKDEDFVTCDSLDFHPTDLIEDADGSLLVIDTGGWYKLCCPTSQLNKPDVLGAIYRVRREGAPRVADPRGLKINWDAAPPAELAGLLGDARPAVRHRAAESLGKKGATAVEAVAGALAPTQGRPARSRVAAVWAAARIDDARARAAVRAALTDPDETVRQAAAHSASVWRDKGAVPGLLRLLESPSLQNRRAAAEALGRTGDGSVIPALLKAAAASTDGTLDHSLTYALIEIGDGKGTAQGLASGEARVRRAAMVALDQMQAAGRTPDAKLGPDVVAAAMDSADVPLRESAAWVAGRHPEWGEALSGALGARLRAVAATPEAREELRTQLVRLARSGAIQTLLAARLTDPGASGAERQVVLDAMAAAGLEAPPDSWVDALTATLASPDPALVAGAVSALRKLPAGQGKSAAAADPLARVARREDLPAAVRVEALAATPRDSLALTPDLFTFLTSQVGPEQPVSVRVQAAEVLGRAKLTPAQLAALADAVRAAGPLEIGRLLGAYEQSSDDEAGLKLVAALKESKAARSLRADSVAPRLAKYSPKVREAAAPLLASLSPDADAQGKRLEQLLTTLPPGDARRGQVVFNSRQAACSTCHAIGYIGGHVGPDLTRVGDVRAERDLLESIVFPSASFVQSFEPVLVDTRGGDRQSGILRRNDAEEVVLLTGPDQETHIPRKDVSEMRPSPVSVMPAGLDQQLAPQDLADLVAFLKACK